MSSLVIFNIIFSPKIDIVTEELERMATQVQPQNDDNQIRRRMKLNYICGNSRFVDL